MLFLAKKVFIFVFIILFCFFAVKTSQAGGVIYHQGLLLDSQSVPLGDAGTEFCFKFSIYDDSEVGAPDTKLWPAGEPSPVAIMVKKGFFSAEIGDSDLGEPLNLPQGIDANLFLQIEAANKAGENCGDGDEEFETLEPRQEIFLPVSDAYCACTLLPTGDFSVANADESGPLCKAQTLILEQYGRIYLPEGENQIAGHGLIPFGQNEAFIPNNSIETSSLIIITPVSFISSPLYIKEKRVGGFVVATAFAPAEDIIFDWIVFHIMESAHNSQNVDGGGGGPALNIDGGSSGPHIDGGAATGAESGSSTPAQSQELPNLAEINEFSSSTPINPLEEGEASLEPLIGQTLGQ